VALNKPALIASSSRMPSLFSSYTKSFR